MSLDHSDQGLKNSHLQFPWSRPTTVLILEHVQIQDTKIGHTTCQPQAKLMNPRDLVLAHHMGLAVRLPLASKRLHSNEVIS